MSSFALLTTCIALSFAAASGQSAISASCLPRLEYEPQIISNPQDRVTFHCDHATRLDLIRAVGFQTRLPLGVVLGVDDKTLSRKDNHYDLDRVDAETALRQAIDGTGYSLKQEAGVWVMIAGDMSSRQSNLLSHTFFDFKPGESEGMVELGFELTMWMGEALEPKQGYAASIPGSTNDERFTMHVAPGATTEEIANEIVRHGSKGLWILKVGASAAGSPRDEVVTEPYQHYTNAAVSRH